MKIESERLRLQNIAMDDLLKLHSYPEVDMYNTLGIPESLEVTIDFFKPIIEEQTLKVKSQYCWSVYYKSNDQFIGLCGMRLSPERFKMAEIYFNISPQIWGKGLGTELAKTMIKFGFEELKLHRIEAGVATENEKSINVLHKSGMTREGIRRKILPIRGEWKDNYHYAILEDDPPDYKN